MSTNITETLIATIRNARRELSVISAEFPHNRENPEWLHASASVLWYLAGVVEAAVATAPAVSQQHDENLRLALDIVVSHAWATRDLDPGVQRRVQWERPHRALTALAAHDLGPAEEEIRALHGELLNLSLRRSSDRTLVEK